MLEKKDLVKIFAVVLLAANLVFNEYLITTIAANAGSDNTMGAQIKVLAGKISPPKKLDGSVLDIVIAHGVPEKYGIELGLSYDKIQESMNIMKQYDQSQYGKGLIKLNAEQMKRYADIGTKISCEFCCSAKAITREDGSAACACGHAIAMRGLIAYLIDKHGSEYNNEQILHEIAQWKGSYFPAKMVQKVTDQIASGNYTPDVAALLMNADKSKLKENIKNAPAAPQTSAQPLPGQQGGC
jgi:hypothetical protein